MKIDYDPNKNQRNINERDLPFDAVHFFHWESADVKPDLRFDYPEPRMIATGYLGETERLYVICFIPIEHGIRVISFRKANKREIKKYEQNTTTLDG